MGLFEDAVRPTHLNRLDIHKRAWRTSLIDSFASNIAFALFKCSDDYRVTAYFQERPVRLPGCSHELCHFREFVNQYGSLAEKCNVEDICRIWLLFSCLSNASRLCNQTPWLYATWVITLYVQNACNPNLEGTAFNHKIWRYFSAWTIFVILILNI